MKGEAAPDEAETQLNLGLNIRINADYIPEENQRLQMYKRVARVETESQLGDVGAELQDRYGPPPPPVRNLLDYASLKLLCMRVGVNAIERKRDFVTFKFRQNAAVDPEQLARFVSAQRERPVHSRRNAEVRPESYRRRRGPPSPAHSSRATGERGIGIRSGIENERPVAELSREAPDVRTYGRTEERQSTSGTLVGTVYRTIATCNATIYNCPFAETRAHDIRASTNDPCP